MNEISTTNTYSCIKCVFHGIKLQKLIYTCGALELKLCKHILYFSRLALYLYHICTIFAHKKFRDWIVS